MNREKAISATKAGAIAACISASITLFYVIIAMSTNNKDELVLWNDPANLIDVLLIFGLAFGIYKKSRIASVTMFIYFVLAKIFISIESGAPSGIIFSLIFLYFFGKAIVGSFVFHKIEKTENPEYKSASKWWLLLAIPSISLLIILFVFGILASGNYIPSTKVTVGTEVLNKDIETLKDVGILYEDDVVDYFYSYGLTSILEGGNVLTNDRVLSYAPDENDELIIYELYFQEIESVELVERGDFFNDSFYVVNGFDRENWFTLSLSTEIDGDLDFIKALENRLK